ncbi:MAG: Calx-beta domain-containing protein, partial [Planctomycetota bacterium]
MMLRRSSLLRHVGDALHVNSNERLNQKQRRRKRTRRLLMQSLDPRLCLATLSIQDAVVNENAGTVDVTIDATGYSSPVSVNWQTADGTATASSDYTSASGSVTIDPASPSETVTISIIDDGWTESGETFYVTLSGASAGTIADDSATIRIDDSIADGLSAPTERFLGGGDVLHSGATVASVGLAPGLSLNYSSLRDGNTLLNVYTEQPIHSVVPDAIRAELTVDGALQQTIHYDTTGLALGDAQRFAFFVENQSRGTGTFEWNLKLIETIGSHESIREFDGTLDLVDLNAAGSGNAWKVSGVHELAISTDYVTLINADGGTYGFVRADIQEGGVPSGQEDTLSGGLVELTSGSFVLTQRDKSETHFDAGGKITSRVDRNGNTTSYTYDTTFP